jgi:hypothetical protein
MSPKLGNQTAIVTVTPQHLAFLIEEGMLSVTVNGEAAHLINGDVFLFLQIHHSLTSLKYHLRNSCMLVLERMVSIPGF